MVRKYLSVYYALAELRWDCMYCTLHASHNGATNGVIETGRHGTMFIIPTITLRDRRPLTSPVTAAHGLRIEDRNQIHSHVYQQPQASHYSMNEGDLLTYSSRVDLQWTRVYSGCPASSNLMKWVVNYGDEILWTRLFGIMISAGDFDGVNSKVL